MTAGTAAADFTRGDANLDGRVDLGDAVATLTHLFLERAPLLCEDAADADDDGELTLTDAVRTLDWLFRGGAALPPPAEAPGPDPTDDALACRGWAPFALRCIDRIAYMKSPDFRVVVRTQEEYERLIRDEYDTALEVRFQTVLESVRENHPGLSEEEAERRAWEQVYSVGPFAGLEDCEFPGLSFRRYSLLGQNTTASGCERAYEREVVRDEETKTLLYRVTVRETGSCEPLVVRLVWAVVEPVPAGWTVRFETEVIPDVE